MQFTRLGKSISDGEQFFQETLSQCSHWRTSAHVGGQKLLTWYGIYHVPLALASFPRPLESGHSYPRSGWHGITRSQVCSKCWLEVPSFVLLKQHLPSHTCTCCLWYS